MRGWQCAVLSRATQTAKLAALLWRTDSGSSEGSRKRGSEEASQRARERKKEGSEGAREGGREGGRKEGGRMKGRDVEGAALHVTPSAQRQ
jgi:hypothetical protein